MPAKRAASATSADQDVVAKVRRIAEDMTRASEATAKEALRTLRASAKNLSSMSERSGEKEVTALAEVHTIMRQYKKSARELQSNEKSALQALGAEVQQVARDQHHAATQELKSIISSTHAAAPKSSEESDFDESEDEALVGPTAAGSAAARPTRVAASKKAPDRAAVSVGGGRKK